VLGFLIVKYRDGLLALMGHWACWVSLINTPTGRLPNQTRGMGIEG